MGNARDHPPINEKVFISIPHLFVKDKKTISLSLKTSEEKRVRL